MSDPFVAEIRMFGFYFAPKGWAQCNGQLLPISQNTALFALLGTYYGGDGKSTFALPDLSGGRSVLGVGQGPGLSERFVGEQGGAEGVALLSSELPNHGHTIMATNSPADVSSPTATTAIARSTGKMGYAPAANLQPLNTGAISNAAGGGAPHNNMMPYQVLNYCIAMQGVFPPRG